MKPRGFVLALLTGALSLSALNAGEQSGQLESNDPGKVSQRPQDKLESPSAALLGRCRKMLDMQTAVYNGTRGLDKILKGRADKTPRPEDRQAVRALARQAKAVVTLASKALDAVESEGSAAAFREVFGELREEMERVQRSLEAGDVGAATQAIQRDIIDTLNEMVAALKKG
jgi:hypothetical protein